ncbi:MAG: hypothetical protein QW735_03690 [archaeon]
MHPNISAKALIVLVVIGIIATMAVATTVSVSTVTLQSENGVQYVVTGNFIAKSLGFEVMPEAVSSSSSVTWTSGGEANTAINAGDWVYVVQLTLVVVPSAATTYTINVQWIQGITGTYLNETMGSIAFSVPTTATAGTTMDFLFDTGSSTFTAPAGITITVG